MEVDAKLVSHVARLAHLQVEAEAAAALVPKLKAVIELFESMGSGQAAAEGWLPGVATARERDDAPGPDQGVAGEAALEALRPGVPHMDGDLFVVPKVID